MTTDQPAKLLYCSFCGKSQLEVRRLIAGHDSDPTPCICDECVLICTEILIECGGFRLTLAPPPEPSPAEPEEPAPKKGKRPRKN